MNSIELELQRAAMSSNSDISILLRKSLVIARKLKVKDFEEWVKLEFSGYQNNTDKTPQYREINGTLQWFNPFNVWFPVISDSAELMDIIENVKIY